MAFKRTGFKNLVKSKGDYFGSKYKLSKQVPFEVGSDVYVLFLGLESGFYETPCHKIMPHKVEGQLVGYKCFGPKAYPTYVKCEGIDEEGNKLDSLCCTLAKKEKERFPEREDSNKRVVSFTTSRIHIPVLILGNILDKQPKSYPITKVSLTRDLNTEDGLKFAYLEFADSTFKKDVIQAYGKKLKEDGEIDYELSEDSEELFEIVREKLINTVVKIHGVEKAGFSAALKEYSFFPFDKTSALAKDSGEEERNAIIHYTDNEKVMAQVGQFLDLLSVEVDKLIPSWDEKSLLEYYNSAVGNNLKDPVEKPASNEKVEILDDGMTEEDMAMLNNALPALVDVSKEESTKKEPKQDKEAPKEEWEEETPVKSKNTKKVETELDDFEFDSDEEEDFFAD